MGKFTINGEFPMIIELDDGKILTGKPNQFDGKKPMGFRLRFSRKPIHLFLSNVGEVWLGQSSNAGGFSHGAHWS
jgi:hypothetical protein